jgi:prepilin-type N-terminal cleavage/methylation domain-containing protein
MKLYNFKIKTNHSGFTLLEILLVVGIIALLAGIVIVAINPARQLAQVRDTERKSDIKQIDGAITQYYIDNGSYPPGLDSSTATEVCNTGSLSTTTDPGNPFDCGSLIDLTYLVPTYLTAIPADPSTATAQGTSYKIALNASSNIYTEATDNEIASIITIGSNTGVTGADVAGETGDEGGSDVDITTGLVVHYKMNDDAESGVALDSAGNIDGTISSVFSSTLSGDGRINNGFNNLRSYNAGILLDSDPFNGEDINDFSIVLWMNLKSGASLSDTLPFNYHWAGPMMYLDGGVFKCYAGGWDTQGLITIEPMTDDAWHHYAFVKDGESFTAYVDGVPTDPTSVPAVISATPGVFAIGMYDNNVAGWVDGALDDFRLYDIALNEEQIDAIRNGGAGTEE